MNHKHELTRRGFLGRSSALGLVVIAPSAILGGCEEEGPNCANPEGLTSQQRQQRQTLGYVEETPEPAKRCDNCNFWEDPTGGSQCGNCTLGLGPVNPNGYCNSWVAMSS